MPRYCGLFAPYKSADAYIFYARHVSGGDNAMFRRRFLIAAAAIAAALVLVAAGYAHGAEYRRADPAKRDTAEQGRHSRASVGTAWLLRQRIAWRARSRLYRGRPLWLAVRTWIVRRHGRLCLNPRSRSSGRSDRDCGEAVVCMVAAEKHAGARLCGRASRNQSFLQRAWRHVRRQCSNRRTVDDRQIGLRRF